MAYKPSANAPATILLRKDYVKNTDMYTEADVDYARWGTRKAIKASQKKAYKSIQKSNKKDLQLYLCLHKLTI